MTYRFTCALCHEPKTSSWTDEDAEREFEAKMPDKDVESVAVVCDGCYRIHGFGSN